MPALARPAGDAHSSVRAHRLNVPGRGLLGRTWSNSVRGRIPYVVEYRTWSRSGPSSKHPGSCRRRRGRISSRRRPEPAHETASDGEGVPRVDPCNWNWPLCAGFGTHVMSAPHLTHIQSHMCSMRHAHCHAPQPRRRVVFKFIVCHRRDSDRDHTHIGKVESSKPSDTSTVPVNACPRVPCFPCVSRLPR